MSDLPEANVSEENLADMVVTSINLADASYPVGAIAAYGNRQTGERFVVFAAVSNVGDDKFGTVSTWRLNLERVS